MRSSLIFLSAFVAVHNIEYSYITSCSIYMRDIKASGPACHPPNHSEVLQSRLTGHPGGRHHPSYHKTHTFTSSGKVASKWPRSWTGRSNHHFTRTLVEAIFLLYLQRKGGRISDATIFSFQESSFCEAPTDSQSLFFSRFHCDCGFLSIAFCLLVH